MEPEAKTYWRCSCGFLFRSPYDEKKCPEETCCCGQQMTRITEKEFKRLNKFRRAKILKELKHRKGKHEKKRN